MAAPSSTTNPPTLIPPQSHPLLPVSRNHIIVPNFPHNKPTPPHLNQRKNQAKAWIMSAKGSKDASEAPKATPVSADESAPVMSTAEQILRLASPLVELPLRLLEPVIAPPNSAFYRISCRSLLAAVLLVALLPWSWEWVAVKAVVGCGLLALSASSLGMSIITFESEGLESRRSVSAKKKDECGEED